MLNASVLPFKSASIRMMAHLNENAKAFTIVVTKFGAPIFDYLLMEVEKTYRISPGLQCLDCKLLFLAWGVQFTAAASLKEHHRQRAHHDSYTPHIRQLITRSSSRIEEFAKCYVICSHVIRACVFVCWLISKSIKKGGLSGICCLDCRRWRLTSMFESTQHSSLSNHLLTLWLCKGKKIEQGNLRHLHSLTFS